MLPVLWVIDKVNTIFLFYSTEFFFNSFGGSSGLQRTLLMALQMTNTDMIPCELFEFSVFLTVSKAVGKFVSVLSSISLCWDPDLICFPQFPIWFESPTLDSLPRVHAGICWWFSLQFPICLEAHMGHLQSQWESDGYSSELLHYSLKQPRRTKIKMTAKPCQILIDN